MHPHNKINFFINHQQSEISEGKSPSFSDDVQVLIFAVNYVKAKDLNFCVFIQLCITNDSDHSTFFMHTAVKWLPRGKTLENVYLWLRCKLAIFP